jgi:hypothetical protein
MLQSGGISIFRLAEGRIAEHWEQLDRLALMQQLGVVPAPGAPRPERLLGSRGADLGPGVFAIEVVCLFFARALLVWFYNVTASSVLLVAIFHASFDGAINQPSYDIVPASNKVRFLIFSVVIMLAATTLIIATKGKLGRAKEAVDIHAGVSDANA